MPATSMIIDDLPSDLTPCGPSLICQHGSLCRLGTVPSSLLDVNLPASSFLNLLFLEKAKNAGHYCECPPGYAGIDCSIPSQICGNTKYKCYFGGECFLGLEDFLGEDELFCDCSLAQDAEGNRFVGKYCENLLVLGPSGAGEVAMPQLVTNLDNQSGPSPTNTRQCRIGQSEDNYVCMNKGFCNMEYPGSSKNPCFCAMGYTGTYCEYEDNKHAIGDPGCHLPCQNGAICRVGRPDPVKNKMAYNLYRQSSIATEFQYCDCPADFYGAICEVSAIPCNDKVCLNNGVCAEWGQAEGGDNAGGTKTSSACGCHETAGASFTGEFCQFAATSYCEQHFEGKSFFCANGGRCRSEVWKGCECPPGYSGFSCEIYTQNLSVEGQQVHISADCDLDCNGRGTCVVGMKDLEYLGDAVHAKHLNVSHDRDFQHCICQDGYTGLQCEHQVEECTNNPGQFCLHGSQCVRDDTTGDQLCDCSTATSQLAPAFAGKNCEHMASSVCSTSDNGDELHFCVNDGICLDPTERARKGVICQCPKGWEGRHCEFRVTRLETASRDMQLGAQFLMIIAMSLLAVAFFARLYYRYRQRQDEGEENDQIVCLRPRRRRRQPRFFRSSRPATVTWAQESTDTYYFYPNSDPKNQNLSPYRETASLVDNDEDIDNDEYSRAIQSNFDFAQLPSPSSSSDEEADAPTLFMGPPRDEDGNELSEVAIC